MNDKTTGTKRQLADGIAMQRQGKFNEAADVYKSLLANNPDDFDALHYLGLAMAQGGRLTEAGPLLERASNLNPHCANTLSDLATVKLKTSQIADALALYGKALSINPNHLDALNNMGKALLKINKPKDALPLFEHLTRIRPHAAPAFFDLASTHYKLGNVTAAIENYRNAVKLDPDNSRTRVHLGEAFESMGQFKQARMQYLSILRREPGNPLALARILQLKDSDPDSILVETAKRIADDKAIQANPRALLNFSIAQYHDRNHLYDEAFQYLRKANDYWFKNRPFITSEFTSAVNRLIRIFGKEFFESTTGFGHSSNLPIFIVGMPRSGTTLTEQILASHSRVAPGGELSMMLDLAQQVQQLSGTRRAYPEGVQDLGRPEFSTLAERYLARLKDVSHDAQRITDKLPFNFIHVGLIAALFPNSRIIHCHRNSLDNCLSCYFTSFNEEIQFANDLTVLGKYYLEYSRLMQHWQSVLPGRILNVKYEAVVRDTEKEVRSILNFCGLEWEDACLDFHNTKGGVKTPSRWQVRQPIYSNSVERWLHYKQHLQPLIDVLGPALADMA